MKLSQLLAPTLKEPPRDAEAASHKLLVRGGFVRPLAAGVYIFLPLGLRVLRKIEAIIRREMNGVGGQELLLSALQPQELWEQSGRWATYGEDMMKVKDRRGTVLGLGPTHEEVITNLAAGALRSYRELPKILYQIQVKFRDEMRPRFGLLRCREFIMKDAYSFHIDREDAEKTYYVMKAAYDRIFQAMGINYIAVEADSGLIGGSLSHEFIALADSGEDTVVRCSSCGYAANIEAAKVPTPARAPGRADVGATSASGGSPLQAVDTPRVRTVEEVAAFLKVAPEQLIKTLIYIADDKPVAVLVRGDREVNEPKLGRALNTGRFRMASAEEIQSVTGGPQGFSGPVGLKGVTWVIDLSVFTVTDGVVGANEADRHYIHFDPERDGPKGITPLDVSKLKAGEPCPGCGKRVEIVRGIEIGHVFYLGTKYAKAMNANVLDENGKSRVVEMGCYGIGVSRLVSAIAEGSHDEKGLIWPAPVAPAKVLVLPTMMDKPEVVDAARRVYDSLSKKYPDDVILDDRDERAGSKFKDADLQGWPVRVVLGRGVADGKAEIQERRTGTSSQVDMSGIEAAVAALLDGA